MFWNNSPWRIQTVDWTKYYNFTWLISIVKFYYFIIFSHLQLKCWILQFTTFSNLMSTFFQALSNRDAYIYIFFIWITQSIQSSYNKHKWWRVYWHCRLEMDKPPTDDTALNAFVGIKWNRKVAEPFSFQPLRGNR